MLQPHLCLNLWVGLPISIPHLLTANLLYLVIFKPLLITVHYLFTLFYLFISLIFFNLFTFQTAAIVPDLISVTEQVNKMMLQKMVPGEGGINISSNHMQIQIDKGQASDILGKAMDMGDGTSVAIPKYCSLMNGTCNENDTVSISVSCLDYA